MIFILNDVYIRFLRAKEWENVISETTSCVTAPCDETNRMDPLKDDFRVLFTKISEREIMNDAFNRRAG